MNSCKKLIFFTSLWTHSSSLSGKNVTNISSVIGFESFSLIFKINTRGQYNQNTERSFLSNFLNR